jgi:RimJ/RimL family protein N-acetyltransferase
MPMPIAAIETERLTLEPFSENFLTERYVGWLNDKDVMAHSRHPHPIHSLDSCREFFESLRADSHYLWAIVAKDEFGHIGNIASYNDDNANAADLTILIGESAVSEQGYGTEAWIGVCRWLFETADVQKITAGTVAANAGMVGIMKKAGMKTERVRDYQFNDGLIGDAIKAVITKEMWKRT